MKGYFGVATHAHIDFPVFRQKLSSFIISRSIYVKRRNELNMKPAAVIHMLSPRNWIIHQKPTRRRLATVSRHPAVVQGGGGVSMHIYILSPIIPSSPPQLLEQQEKYKCKK